MIDTIFSIGNTAILPAWLLLAVAPKWPGTQWLAAIIAPLLLALAYTLLMMGSMTGMLPPDGNAGGDVSFSTIEGIRNIFASDAGVVIGWFHYLAFDLFVGAWEGREARRIGLSHWLLIPCLFLTLMLGPVGFLLFMILRTLRQRKVLLPGQAATATH